MRSKWLLVKWKRNLCKIPDQVLAKLEGLSDTTVTATVVKKIMFLDIAAGTYQHLGLRLDSNNRLLFPATLIPRKVEIIMSNIQEGLLPKPIGSEVITIYTDGACTGSPGPDGYGVVLMKGKYRKELSGNYARTTNNRMEILAVIVVLEVLKKPSQLVLYIDSRYVIDTMIKGWAKSWKANGWRRVNGEPAINAALWERLLPLTNRHQVKFEWVKGQAGDAGNERCDYLAREATRFPKLPDDTGHKAGLQAANGGRGPSQTSLFDMLEEKDSSAPSTTSEQGRTTGGKINAGKEMEDVLQNNTNFKSCAKFIINRERHPCRKCGTPVEKRIPSRNHKPGQSYCFEYYFHCPGCKTMYMVEEAKAMLHDTLAKTENGNNSIGN